MQLQLLQPETEVLATDLGAPKQTPTDEGMKHTPIAP